MRKKEDAVYRKRPKEKNSKLKTTAGLQPIARDQPNLATITVPGTKKIISNPQTILETLQTHFEIKQSRVAPDTLHIPPVAKFKQPRHLDHTQTLRHRSIPTITRLPPHSKPLHHDLTKSPPR